jgi:hypothetical protein
MMTSKQTSPYLSVIVAARNDNYGGDFIGRLKRFAESLARASRAYPDLFELIVVEWNPPPDRPPLSEAIDWSDIANVRIIVVPPELHRPIPNSDRLPMFDCHAKNVGIRRARGKFALTTNADIVFPIELFDWFSTRSLSPDCFYRVDRHDFIANGTTEAEFMESVCYVNVRHSSNRDQQIHRAVQPATPISIWPQSEILPGDEISQNGRLVLCRNTDTAMWGLHTNASGDFILASVDAWSRANGHWERSDTFLHIDSFMICQLAVAGYRQILLRRPLTILHAEHGRSARAERPQVEYAILYDQMEKVAAGTLTTPFEQENWGMPKVALREIWSGSLSAV